MGRLTRNMKHITKAVYVENDCWAIVNKEDFITHIAPSKHRLKVMYVGSFETLDDDPTDIDDQFETLLEDTGDLLVNVSVHYEVERTEEKKGLKG